MTDQQQQDDAAIIAEIRDTVAGETLADVAAKLAHDASETGGTMDGTQGRTIGHDVHGDAIVTDGLGGAYIDATGQDQVKAAAPATPIVDAAGQQSSGDGSASGANGATISPAGAPVDVHGAVPEGATTEIPLTSAAPETFVERVEHVAEAVVEKVETFAHEIIEKVEQL